MIAGNWHHYWLPLAILGGLVALTAWMGELADQRPLQDQTAGPGHRPDYFVDDLRATAYDVAGVPRYHLTATKMVHFMDDNTTSLETPVFLRDGPGVPRVLAQATRGRVSANGDIVYFIDDVHLTQDSQSGGPPLQLATQYLEVMPNADRLQTDRPVTLTEGSTVVTANSMTADGRARTVQLDGRVKGIYETHH